MKEYKYINMKLIKQHPKTAEYQCNNNRSGEELGVIKWYPAWRQYCYFPTCPAVYSKGCLKDINDFIDTIEKERKENRDESS